MFGCARVCTCARARTSDKLVGSVAGRSIYPKREHIIDTRAYARHRTSKYLTNRYQMWYNIKRGA